MANLHSFHLLKTHNGVQAQSKKEYTIYRAINDFFVNSPF